MFGIGYDPVLAWNENSAGYLITGDIAIPIHDRGLSNLISD